VVQKQALGSAATIKMANPSIEELTIKTLTVSFQTSSTSSNMVGTNRLITSSGTSYVYQAWQQPPSSILWMILRLLTTLL
jgi:hypothetical protein